MKKTKLLVLSLLFAGSFLAQANADLLYSEDFNDSTVGTDAVGDVDGITNLGNAADRTDSWVLGGNGTHVTIDGGTLNVNGNVTPRYRAAITILDDVGATGTMTLSFGLTAVNTPGWNGALEVYTVDGFSALGDVTFSAQGGLNTLYTAVAPGGTATSTLAATFDIDADPTLGTKMTTFAYTTGQAVILRFAADTTPAVGFAYSIDNLQIEGTAVPEPTCLLLVGITTLGLVVRRRRKI